MSFTFNHSEDESFPPSPADDRGSKRLSWGNLVQRLIELKRINQSLTADQWSRSETGSLADMSTTSESSVFCEPEEEETIEETICERIIENIALNLNDTEAFDLLRCSRLILPDLLLQNIRQELLHMADCEPCGLRGALIDLCVEREEQGGLVCVDQVAVDPSLVPTFHLTLVLRPETGGLWPKVQKLFKGVQSPQKQRHIHTLTLSTGFRAIKRKLYTSGELLIEEC